MKRFLVCCLYSKKGDKEGMPFSWKAFPLRFATTPDEVSTPFGTAFYFFTSEESLEELYKRLCIIKLGGTIVVSPDEFKSEGPLFIYGKEVVRDGQRYVVNLQSHSFFPISDSSEVEILEP